MAASLYVHNGVESMMSVKIQLISPIGGFGEEYMFFWVCCFDIVQDRDESSSYDTLIAYIGRKRLKYVYSTKMA